MYTELNLQLPSWITPNERRKMMGEKLIMGIHFLILKGIDITCNAVKQHFAHLNLPLNE